MCIVVSIVSMGDDAKILSSSANWVTKRFRISDVADDVTNQAALKHAHRERAQIQPDDDRGRQASNCVNDGGMIENGDDLGSRQTLSQSITRIVGEVAVHSGSVESLQLVILAFAVQEMAHLLVASVLAPSTLVAAGDIGARLVATGRFLRGHLVWFRLRLLHSTSIFRGSQGDEDSISTRNGCDLR